MPLHKLQLKPGVNRESTSLANEGGWYESDKVRFRSGYPEKIGGWALDNGPAQSALKPPTGNYWGTCRSLFNWRTQNGKDLLGIGTHLKYNIQDGPNGYVYDVTPLRRTTAAGAVSFAATAGLPTILVSDTAHGASTGDFVTFSGAVGLGGAVTTAVINAEFQITYVSANTYRITVATPANASDSGNGGGATVGAYQVSGGPEIFETATGWGAGGWGGVNPGYASTGWGAPAPAALGIASDVRIWSASNYGQDLLLNPRGGALYYWAVNSNPNVYDRAQQLTPGGSVVVRGTSIAVDSSVPLRANMVLVSDSSRFVFALGTNDYGTSNLDPLLIRWSDQEQFNVWAPAVTNQAGSYRLSLGSKIVTAQQTRQEILVFTDAALYSMQYLGPPYVWGTQILGSNISIVGPNAVATAGNTTFWMGRDKFYRYTGRVEALPCTLFKYVFGNINHQQFSQFVAGTNEGFNEIWWFYCSASSTTIDRYVIYNYLEDVWAYGSMARTAWWDSSLRGTPVGAGYNGQTVYHEVGTDDGTTNPPSPIAAYVQTADQDIGDGHNFGLVWRIIPDVTFDGSVVANPSVVFTLRPRHNPGSNYGPTKSPDVVSEQNYTNQPQYTVQQFTQYVNVRVRGRQLALKVSSDDLGVAWQLGACRIEIRPDGRR